MAVWLLPVISDSSASEQYERSPRTLWYEAMRRSVRDLKNEKMEPKKNHAAIIARMAVPAISPSSIQTADEAAPKMPETSSMPPASLSAPAAFLA